MLVASPMLRSAWLIVVLIAGACEPPPAPHRLTGLERERAIAARQARHQPSLEGGEVRLARALVGGAGLHAGPIALRLSAIGRPGAMRAVEREGRVAIAGPEVRIARAPEIVEWWRSLDRGLEHGVTLGDRPPGRGALRLELTTGVRCTAAPDGAIVLRDEHGRELARYGELLVVDARRRRVPAVLVADAGDIAIELDDRGARYPIVVDPLLTGVEEAELIGGGAAPQDRIGESVALSGDATRAIVGAPGHAFTVGAARVWIRSGTSWTLEATLMAPDAAQFDNFGEAVAASSNASRVIVGVPGDDTTSGSDRGSARVFIRSGTMWAQESALVSSGTASGAMFGAAVSMSDDGLRAVVGAPREDVGAVNRAGSAHVFAFDGARWTEEATWVAPSPSAFDELGTSVAISGDGTRAIVGVPGADTVHGSAGGNARVYVRSGSTWTEEAVLVPAEGGNDAFGTAVALSADGTRALIGAPDAGFAYERVHVFVRSGSTWTAGPAPMRPMATTAFGHAVAWTRDGSRAVIGAPPSSTSTYPVYVYQWDGAAWTLAAQVASRMAEGADRFGTALAIADDGSRILAGASGKDAPGLGNIDRGIARVFRLEPAAADGAPCASGPECLSGFCVDGVCCNAGCNGTVLQDCQACVGRLTGLADGSCAPVMAGVECRASTGTCDAAEACNGTSRNCPTNVGAPASTPCRAPSGPCDVEDVCGVAGTCPPIYASMGTVCREAAGVCDLAEVCSGTSGSCPADEHAPAGTECRAAAGPCDRAELCPGGVGSCPADAFAAADVVCRAPIEACDLEERCDGAGAQCPPDVRACTDAGTPVDGGVDGGVDVDAGPGEDAGVIDAGSSAIDAGSSDAGSVAYDAGAFDAGPGGSEGGCACRSVAHRPARTSLLFVIAIAVRMARRRAD